jgi:hypothetical protein
MYQIFDNDLSPDEAVQIILQHRAEVLKLGPVKVFVFVDEFRKLFDECHENQGDYHGQDMAVLKSIGILLSQPEKHTVVISTLESTPLVKDGSFFSFLPFPGVIACICAHLDHDFHSLDFVFDRSATRSGRQVVYLPVRPLDGLEQFKKSPWIHHASVKRVVAELGGHPRGLRFLRETLETMHSNMSLPPTYEGLFYALSMKFSRFKLIETSPQMIAACLLGVTVPWSQQPSPATAHTYSYYIGQVGDLQLRSCVCVCVCVCVINASSWS